MSYKCYVQRKMCANTDKSLYIFSGKRRDGIQNEAYIKLPGGISK